MPGRLAHDAAVAKRAAIASSPGGTRSAAADALRPERGHARQVLEDALGRRRPGREVVASRLEIVVATRDVIARSMEPLQQVQLTRTNRKQLEQALSHLEQLHFTDDDIGLPPLAVNACEVRRGEG
jgi:hypothetical protein